MNNLALSAALATAPSSAFNELRERPRFWFPLVVVLLTSIGLMAWYFSVVDIDWYKETVLANLPKIQQMDEEKRATVLGMYTGKTLLWGSAVSLLIFIPLMFVLQSVILLVVAKLTKLSQGFKHWFAMACWTSLPVLLGTVVAAILLLLSDTPQISPGTLQPLSLNELVFHVPPGPGYQWVSSLGIPAFLGWALMIIGVRVWSQRSWAFSAIFILAPVVTIYGIWSLFAFR